MATTLPTTLKPTIVGISKSRKARMLEANFGGGYRQRAADGLNPIEITMNLEWIGSTVDIEELETHFEERAGYQSFTISGSWVDDTSYKWTCQEWDVTYAATSIPRLTATLRKENDLI